MKSRPHPTILRDRSRRTTPSTPIVAKAYVLAHPTEPRLIPSAVPSKLLKKYGILYPLFLLRSQAAEFLRNGKKENRWTTDPVIMQVEIREIIKDSE